MPVRRPQGRHLPRDAAGNGNQVNEGSHAFRLVADGELRAVGRDAVVVVAAVREAGVHDLGLAALARQPVNAAAAIEKEPAPIR